MYRSKFTLIEFLIVSIVTMAAPAAVPGAEFGITAEAPGAAFTSREKPEFRLAVPEDFSGEWQLRDWDGALLKTGTATDPELVLAPLECGYYVLTVTGQNGQKSERSFAVVRDPADRNPGGPQPFALDAAVSWLGRPDPKNPFFKGEGFDTIIELARRAGCPLVRERLSWGETNPEPGVYRWKQYGSNAQKLAEKSVGISGMFHDSPKWTRTHSPKLPDDLAALHDYARTLSSTFKGRITDWEFWNEQDIGFAPEPAWDYAAALKAAALGFKAGDPDVPVLLGGIAFTPLANCNAVAMLNDAAAYIDIFNVHCYRPLTDFSDAVTNIRALMNRAGIAGMPLWITELGCLSEGSGRASSGVPGTKAHTPDQELLVAEYLVKSQLMLQALGVEKSFFFVLAPYNEIGGAKDWGLMRRDYTVKPGYAAYANLTDRLGAATFEGRYETGVPQVDALLYRMPDGTQTLVFWSRSEFETQGTVPGITAQNRFARVFTLKRIPPGARLFDLTGMERPLKRETTGGVQLTATRFPAYLTGLSGLKAKAVSPAVRPVRVDVSDMDRTIVAKATMLDGFSIARTKDSIDWEGDSGGMRIELYNFSDTKKRGRLRISGGRVEGVPAEVTIPARGRTEFTLRFQPEVDQKSFAGQFELNGEFGGRRISRLHIPVLARHLMASGMTSVPFKNLMDPSNWRASSSGKLNISYDKQEQAVKFDVKFRPQTDRWIYPEYILQLPQESLKDAAGIAFEVKAEPAGAIKQMLAMFVNDLSNDRGKAVWLQVNPPDAKWQERVVSFHPEIPKPDKIRMLRIGFNLGKDHFTYYLRNFRILYNR